MPTILGANSATGGYEISNSYKIDQGSAVGMARFGNNSRNGNTFTISFWIKRTKLGEFQTIVTSKVEDSGVNAFLMSFQSNDTIKVQGQPASGTGAGASRDYLQTSAVYRDASAWYHIVYRLDTTQSTASNRHRLYVNGVEQAKATDNPLDQNVGDAYFYNAGSYPYAIGNDERDNDYGNFYMAEHHYTDGVSNGPDAFGEYNDNGVWIPKEYTGSHGSYGHYLKFENTGGGSGTTAVGGHNYTTGSSSTIGADSSGNDNHFHVQGYSTEDNTTDTPTNNFCTLNPLHKSTSDVVLSEGNLKMVSGYASGWQHAAGTMAVQNGKWYWEAKATTVSASDKTSAGVLQFDTSDVDFIGNTNTDRSSKGISGHGAGTGSYSYSQGDIIMCAMDIDNNKIYWGKNGTFFGTLDPANGTGSTTQTIDNNNFCVPAVGGYGGSTWEMNFGVPQFSISSGNADANGYGNFEYAPPSGFYSLCTKNLAEYG